MSVADPTLENPAVREFGGLRVPALVIGVVAMVILVVGAFLAPDEFFRAYLFGYIFWVTITLGFLFLALVHNVVGGAWGYIIRRFLEAGMGLIPLMTILFIPILFGLPSLYSWARPEVVATDALIQQKTLYLNVPFFIIRAVIYFAVWNILAYLLRQWSLKRDETADAKYTLRMKRLGAGGVILWALTSTFAYYDWLMSLDAHWFSSIYGAMIAIPGVLCAMGFTIIVLSRIHDRPPLAEVTPRKLVNDLGNLLMGFTIISTYLAFSQFLIIWSANLPEEVIWYTHRWDGGWQWMAWFIAVFRFILPLLILLSRRVKRDLSLLFYVAVMLMVAHLVDMYWQIYPTYYPSGISLHWLSIVAPIAFGGIWVAGYFWLLGRRAILPLYIPALPERYKHG